MVRPGTCDACTFASSLSFSNYPRAFVARAPPTQIVSVARTLSSPGDSCIPV